MERSLHRASDWAQRPVNNILCDGRELGRHEWVSTMCALHKTMERSKRMEPTERRGHPCQNLSANPFADQGCSLPPPGPQASLSPFRRCCYLGKSENPGLDSAAVMGVPFIVPSWCLGIWDRCQLSLSLPTSPQTSMLRDRRSFAGFDGILLRFLNIFETFGRLALTLDCSQQPPLAPATPACRSEQPLCVSRTRGCPSKIEPGKMCCSQRRAASQRIGASVPPRTLTISK